MRALTLFSILPVLARRTSGPSTGGVTFELSRVNKHLSGNQLSCTAPNDAGLARARGAAEVDGGHGEIHAQKKPRTLSPGVSPGSDNNMTAGNGSGKGAGSTCAPRRICVTCGTTESPEWRKGPLGARTLCNACGLRWAKRDRKKEVRNAVDRATGGGEVVATKGAQGTTVWQIPP